jgi:hypothetical protein
MVGLAMLSTLCLAFGGGLEPANLGSASAGLTITGLREIHQSPPGLDLAAPTAPGTRSSALLKGPRRGLSLLTSPNHERPKPQ